MVELEIGIALEPDMMRVAGLSLYIVINSVVQVLVDPNLPGVFHAETFDYHLCQVPEIPVDLRQGLRDDEQVRTF